MVEHVCNKEDSIDILTESVEKIRATIYGNGQPGMKADMACIKTKIENIETTMTSLATSTSGILQYINETKGAEKQKLSNKQKTRVIISSIISIAGIIISLIIKFA